jgi:hypothetical protein
LHGIPQHHRPADPGAGGKEGFKKLLGEGEERRNRVIFGVNNLHTGGFN